jgi:hypothetical protein
MKKFLLTVYLAAILFMVLPPRGKAMDYAGKDSTFLFFFLKREFNTGMVFDVSDDREEFRSGIARQYEELLSGSARLRMESRNWDYSFFRQEELSYYLDAGPIIGKGNIIDSSATYVTDARQEVAGLRTNGMVNYGSRFYYDRDNFTLVRINVWGRYDFFRRTSEGTFLDSNRVSSPYSKQSGQGKFRAGIKAAGGWGRGRLVAMNHYMTAEYLLKKYYAGRLFSEKEIFLLGQEIGRIKHQRDPASGHSPEQEAEQIKTFLSRKMILEAPATISDDWQMGEFFPRFQGTRVEAGPFFNYFNREPDFVYGGYIKVESAKYCHLKWNRFLQANLSYSGYKKQDWILLETEAKWTYYPNLKSSFGFGLKYVPGLILYAADDVGPLRHNFIPFINYYSQMNARCRVDFSFSWKITDSEQFMLPGPELSVSFYRSRY